MRMGEHPPYLGSHADGGASALPRVPFGTLLTAFVLVTWFTKPMITERSQLDFVRDELARIESLHQRRSLKRLETGNTRTVVFEGKKLFNFSSNDYLGLSQDERVQKAAKDAIDGYHASSASSRLICGNMNLHEQLEEELADFKEREAALVFSSGYMANIGLLSALAGERDLICSDELNHASIID